MEQENPGKENTCRGFIFKTREIKWRTARKHGKIKTVPPKPYRLFGYFRTCRLRYTDMHILETDYSVMYLTAFSSKNPFAFGVSSATPTATIATGMLFMPNSFCNPFTLFSTG